MSDVSFQPLAQPAADTAPLLDVRDLRIDIVSRDGKRVLHVVQGVSFSVGRGRTLGIVGESGCGKSTTAMAIMKLLPQAATIVGGQIVFDGEDVVPKSNAQMRPLRGKRIGMIMQDPMVAMDPLFTVGDQLAESPRQHLGLEGQALRDRQIELLQAVGIPSPETRLKQYPHQMSGGMLQRIVGAIAISCDPDLLIADEPTTALDPTAQANFLDMLGRLRDSRGLSLIIVTHDFGVTAEVCDDVVVMYAGRIAEQGPVASIFGNPRHPYTQALLSAIPDPDAERSGRLTTISGQPPDLSHPIPGCPFAPRCMHAEDQCRQGAPPPVRVGEGHIVSCWKAAS